MASQDFLGHFRARFQDADPTQSSLRPDAVTAAIGSIERSRTNTAQPELSAEDRRRLAGARSPVLQQVVLRCVDILRRRPQLAATIGIGADEIEAMRKKEIDQDMLAGLSARLGQLLRDGLLIHTSQLGERNAALAEQLEGFLRSSASPQTDRGPVSAALEAMRQAESRRMQRAERPAALREGRAAAEEATTSAAAERREILELKQALLRTPTN
jgi:hypothetical protein